MEQLWKKKEDFVEYSAKKITISMTFGGNREKILCYERNYNRLSPKQLQELLKIAREERWTTLDLSNCGIEELPDELWDIQSLKVLYLGNISSQSDDCNTFTEISERIEALQNLEAISFCNIRNIKIPKAMKRLPQLTYIDCFGCQFGNITENMLNRNIRAIGIDCNTVEQLKKICKIKRIQEIFLTGSEIKALPEEIGELKYLRILHLTGSRIEVVPESLLNLKRLRFFNISATPLEKKIPEEMRKQTAHELISFICKQQKQQETYFFNESKMIIVGQGSVGKSCLMERIVDDKYEEKESTEGIDVKKWTYTINEKNYVLNIWDFGGQEIYHSTHQFFLTKRSLYILVWDARSEEEYGRIDYWLKTIESFAEDSPIIICINKCDKNTTRINRIDFREYKEKYPQITTILDISCKDNINISRLKTLIKEQASGLQIAKEKWLKSWYDIRTEIERMSEEKKYITHDEYISICQKYDVGREEAKSLSKYLHDLGVILHYQDDSFLKSIVILSPKWSTSAVYKILDSQENILRGRNGVLYLSDLPNIWKDSTMYPEDKYIFLLKIMEKFELCYALNRESYLVTELLENTSIECPKEWDLSKKSCIGIIYRYDFMPAGVMTRFIVKVHDYIANVNGKSMCWRKGVYLKYKTAYAQVVMKDTISEKKIEVKVNKQDNSMHERELLFIIRQALNEVNSNFKKIHVEEFVPCNCEPDCEFVFPYDRLCTAIDKKVTKMQCHNSFKHVSVLKLLEGIDIMKTEDMSPYSISIQNNPIITNTNTNNSEANVSQTNITNILEMKSIVMEMQGDLAEIREEISEELPETLQEDVNKELEKINNDLESISGMESVEEVIKSGKLNKIRRWLMDFSNEESELRKTLSGVKHIAAIVGGMVSKFNNLAEKLGVNTLPFS